MLAMDAQAGGRLMRASADWVRYSVGSLVDVTVAVTVTMSPEHRPCRWQMA